MICLGNCDSSRPMVAYFLLILAVGGCSGGKAGFFLNQLDIAPNHAGTLMGIVNGFSNTFGMLAPIACQYLVRNEVKHFSYSFSDFYIEPCPKAHKISQFLDPGWIELKPTGMCAVVCRFNLETSHPLLMICKGYKLPWSTDNGITEYNTKLCWLEYIYNTNDLSGKFKLIAFPRLVRTTVKNKHETMLILFCNISAKIEKKNLYKYIQSVFCNLPNVMKIICICNWLFGGCFQTIN